MSNTSTARFSCNACGKSFAFKPEYANKRVKCKCGSAIQVPDLSEPDGLAALSDDIFDMVDQQREIERPVAAVAMANAAADAAAAHGSRPEKKPVVARPGGRAAAAVPGRAGSLNYASGPSRREQRQAARMNVIHDMKRDIYVPTALIAISFVAFTLFTVFFDSMSGMGAAIFTLVMGAVFLVKTLFMIGGAFILAPILGVSFGPFWTAILKLAAVAMAPDVLATIIEDSIGVTGAGILANSIALAFYWFLISYLFQIDASEAWYVVIGFAILRWVLTFVVGMIVLGMIMSGKGEAMLDAASAAGGGGGSTSSLVAAYDAEVDELVGTKSLEEAKQYIAGGRRTGLTDHVNGWYAAGAKNVYFHVTRDINDKSEPMSLIVELPADKTKRAAIFKLINDYYKALQMAEEDVAEDDGGKYVEVDIPYS